MPEKVNEILTGPNVQSINHSGGAVEINLSRYNTFIITLSANLDQLTIRTNSIIEGETYKFIFVQGGTAYTVTLPSEFTLRGSTLNEVNKANTTTSITFTGLSATSLIQDGIVTSNLSAASVKEWGDYTTSVDEIANDLLISYANNLYICNTTHTKEASFDVLKFDLQNSVVHKSEEFAATASQTVFTISGAVAGEIYQVDDIIIKGINQPSTAYNITTVTVTNDSITIYPSTGQELNAGDIVVIQYYSKASANVMLDTDSVHLSIAAEVSTLTEKGVPVGADMLLIEDSADSNNKKKVLISSLGTASGSVLASLYNANTILVANADDTPLALTIPEQTIVGRITAGNIGALTATEIRTLLNVVDGATENTNAIETDNIAEISGLTEKGSPVGADVLLIEDSAASYGKKKVQISNLPTGSGSDVDAIHDNVANEISAITEKTTPVSADILVIEDSAASYVKKKVQLSNLPYLDADAIHDNVSGEINSITEKTSTVPNDILLIEDSASSNAKKRVLKKNLVKETIIIVLGSIGTDHTVTTNVYGFHMPYAFYLEDIELGFDPIATNASPTGAAFIVDVNVGNTDGTSLATILSTKLSVDAGEYHSSTAATAAVISTNSIAIDKWVSFDVDQIGSTLAGQGATVYLHGYRN